MKYWNKDKNIRLKHWYKVPIPWWHGGSYNQVKRKLQLQDGPGRFYLYYGSTNVWFEREQDAMWFILKGN